MQTQIEQSGIGANDWVASITYRSEAARRPSSAELNHLVEGARTRNRSIGITGMLLSDGGRFLQTLEGPPASVAQLWASIKRDTRHGGIEVLSEHAVPARLFSGWDMQLYSRDGHQPMQIASGAGSVVALADHVAAIARFALSGDDQSLNALIADLVAQGLGADTLVKQVIEPTARVIGDAWLADDCSELDLTIGLSMLQLAGHAVQSSPTPDRLRQSRYSILLATAPGEPHLLGTSLLSDMFANAGWDVDMTFPDSSEALAKQLRSQRPDAVDISLSDALPRHHVMTALRETIVKSRQASPDDMMVVSVGGRLFAEAAATALSVGADHARTSAAGTSVRLARLIEERRQTAVLSTVATALQSS